MTKRIWLAWFAVISLVADAQDGEPTRSEVSSNLNCLSLKPVESPDGIVQGDQIICSDKKRGSVSIAVHQVTGITYDFASLSSAEHFSENPLDYFYPQGGIIGLGTLVIGPLVAKGMNTRLQPHHYVFINWNNDGEEKTAVFRVQEKAVSSFLSRLSQVTGKEYKDRFLESTELPAGALCSSPTTETLPTVITRDYLRCVDTAGRIVDVLREQIQRVAYDAVRLTDGSAFEERLDQTTDSGRLGWPLRFATEHVPHERQHYTFVYWLDNGRSRVAVYRLNDELRPRFLVRLKEIGLDWDDAAASRERLRAEVDAVPKSGRAQIYVDRPIRVGPHTIGPAFFEFVILESETGLDRLYIRDLSVISSRRRLVVPAHVIPTNDHWSHGDVVYEDATEEIPEVQEIRFPMRKIRPIS